jgi:tetratricopeptide (TPR) repeat protein
MIKRILFIFLSVVIIPSFLFSEGSCAAEPQISKEIEKEWFLREKNPESMKNIREKGLDEGIGNIEEISASLVTEGYRTLKNDSEKAMTLFHEAKELSPDYPPAYYASGKAYWKHSAFNIFKTLDEFLSGFKASFRNFWWSFFTVGNISIALIISALLSFLLFSILMVIRYFPLLKHDIRERLTQVPSLIFKLSPFFIIALFLFLNPGFIYLYLLVLILLWPYFSVREKGIGLFSLAFLAFIPLIIPLLLLFVSAQSSPGLKAIVEINKGWTDKRGIADLEDHLKNNPEDKEALLSLALAKKRSGSFTEALTLFKNLSDVESFSDRAYNNIGNVYAARKNFEGAIANYNKALEKNPNLVSAHYNLSQVYRETLMFDEGEKEYEEARKIDPDLLKTFSSLKGQSFNRLVIDEGLRKSEIWRNAINRTNANEKLAESIWMKFMKWVPLRKGQYLFLLLFLFFLAYGLILRKGHSVYSCIKCGNVVCVRCQLERTDQDLCEQCHKILILMEGSSQDRVAKILELRRFSDRKMGILEGLMFFPGIGHLYEGKSIRGTIFVFLFTFLFSWWFMWDYLRIPFKIYPSFLGPAKFSFMLFSLVIYYLLYTNGRRLLR